MERSIWPELQYSEWADCCQTLQFWLQIVGKIRLRLTPHLNHSWNVTLYPTVRGLTTHSMWCNARTVAIQFDFLTHELVISVDDGGQRKIPLRSMTVAEFYDEVMEGMKAVG